MLYEKLKNTLFLIAGPCVIESEKTTLKTAEFLKKLSQKHKFLLVFKSSFEKANRTSSDSFVGLGIDRGMAILEKVKSEFNLPILTDVHLPNQVPIAKEVCDILQIPAFLSRQTALLAEAGKSGKIVNIKKAQFMAAQDLRGAIDKCDSEKILLTERGTTFGYHNLVVDFRNFIKMKTFGFPVVYDVSHSLQQPSIGKTSGGTPQFAIPLAKAALATGAVDGLFVETHPNPKEALSDASTMLDFSQIERLAEARFARN